MQYSRAATLEEAVRRTFGTAVRVDRVVALAGDASTRSYERVYLAGGSAPSTAIAMWLADRGVSISSDELAVLPDHLAELPYVNVHRFLKRLGVPVPETYADCSAQGLLLIEDVGDLCLWDAVSRADPNRVERLFQRAIGELVNMQVRGTELRDSTCIAFQQQFDAKLYLWECHHFLEWGIERRLQVQMPASERQELEHEFELLAGTLDRVPRFLAHRDFHSWNLFVQEPGERIRVIDFQDALLAAPAYDLATLLGDRDTPQVVDPDRERRLTDFYLQRWLEAGGPQTATTDFERTYHLCALQKALKVVGRFYYLALAKQKPHYLRYIPGTVRQVHRLLPLFPEFAYLARVFRRHFPL